MPEPLRVVMIADLHYGPDTPTKIGSAAPGLLSQAIRQMLPYKPDLLVDLGDRLNDEAPERDLGRLKRLGEALSPVEVPHVHLLGNHDLVHLTREASEEALGVQHRHRSCDVSGWHLVFWFADCTYGPGGFEATEADLAWLEEDLASTQLPTVLFSHVPLVTGSMVGNYYFEDNPKGRASYLNSERIRGIVERGESMVLCVAGHVHWNSLNTIDGVHYLTIQSLTETFTTHPHPADAWALLELGSDIRVRVFGRDPLELKLPIRRTGSHWLARDKRQGHERAVSRHDRCRK